MAERPPAELYYFAFYPKDWLSSPAVRRMAREDRGDFMDLLCLAWGNGTVEPSLEKDDFGTVSERVRAQFRERDGRFYNEKLSIVWRESQSRHAQAVKRGKRSGAERRRRKRLETKSKQFRDQVEQQSQQRPLSMSLRESIDSLVVPAGALALEGARPTERRTSGEAVLVGAILRGMDERMDKQLGVSR